MLFQPSNVIPSSFAGTGKGVIDVDDYVNISFQLNGSSDLVAFAFAIYPHTGNVTTDAQPIYVSNKIVVSPSIPPRTATGEPNTYTYAPSGVKWSDYGLTNGKEYTYEIIQFMSGDGTYTHTFTSTQSGMLFVSVKYQNVYYVYWATTPSTWTYMEFDYSTYEIMVSSNNEVYFFSPIIIGDASVVAGDLFTINSSTPKNSAWVRQYSQNAITTRATPTLSISTTSTTVPKVTFTGTFSQSDGDTVSQCRWSVQNKTTGEVLADTGMIDTSVMQYTYDGFISSGFFSSYQYKITLEVLTSSGVTAIATLDNFTVTYDADFRFDSKEIAQADGGILLGFTGDYDSFTIYQKPNALTLRKIAAIDTKTDVIDYTGKAGEKFRYFLLAKDGADYDDGGESTEFCISLNAYPLYITHPDADDANIFHVEDIIFFGSNISSSAISNNNSPEWLENFTGYRFRQQTSRKGKSGTLSALISNVDDMNDYNDTVEQMEKLYALSQTDKTLFLKDMKGNMYMIAVAAPITQQINTASGKQEVTISLPWEEVGSCDNVSLIKLVPRT